MDADNYVKEIAAYFGKHLTHFSKALGVKHQTVAVWAKNGEIPDWRDHQIIAASKKLSKEDRDSISALLESSKTSPEKDR